MPKNVNKLEFEFSTKELKKIINQPSKPENIIICLELGMLKIESADGKTQHICTSKITARAKGAKLDNTKKMLTASGDGSDVTADGYPIPPGIPDGDE